MNEDIHFDSMDEVYEIMRNNLHDTHTRLLDTIKDIEDEKKPAYEIINNLIEFCDLSYSTLDAMLQIQLGLIKDKELKK